MDEEDKMYLKQLRDKFSMQELLDIQIQCTSALLNHQDITLSPILVARLVNNIQLLEYQLSRGE